MPSELGNKVRTRVTGFMSGGGIITKLMSFALVIIVTLIGVRFILNLFTAEGEFATWVRENSEGLVSPFALVSGFGTVDIPAVCAIIAWVIIFAIIMWAIRLFYPEA